VLYKFTYLLTYYTGQRRFAAVFGPQTVKPLGQLCRQLRQICCDIHVSLVTLSLFLSGVISEYPLKHFHHSYTGRHIALLCLFEITASQAGIIFVISLSTEYRFNLLPVKLAMICAKCAVTHRNTFNHTVTALSEDHGNLTVQERHHMNES